MCKGHQDGVDVEGEEEEGGEEEKAKDCGSTLHQTKGRFRLGTMALREIRRFQRSTNLLICKLPFAQ